MLKFLTDKYVIYLLSAIIAGLLIYGFVQNNITKTKINNLHREVDEMQIKADSLNAEIDEINNLYLSLLHNMENIGQVDVTVYQPVEAQTNNRPWETADESIIDLNNPKAHRWVAVSRDLHSRYGGPLQFGDIVWLTGVGEYSGVYEVRDLMNKRFTDRVDILIGVDDEIFSYINEPNVHLYKIPTETKKFLVDSQVFYMETYQNITAE